MASATTGHGHKDMKNTGETYAQEAKDKGGAAMDKAAGMMDKAKEVGSNVMDKASDMASNVAQGTRRAAENLGERADNAMHSMGSGVRSMGETLRENLPSSGVLGGVSSRVASTLDSTGRYLEQHGFGNIGEDFTTLIRRNPIPALLCAAAIGFLFARASSSRS
jgi:ElaB/YqjD/DUF883 family membrane-anchored ribosome-binding protein